MHLYRTSSSGTYAILISTEICRDNIFLLGVRKEKKTLLINCLRVGIERASSVCERKLERGKEKI